MNFLEKDLEEIILQTPNLELNKRGLSLFGRKLKQLKIGNYGTADIVTIDRVYNTNSSGGIIPVLSITVYELKKDKIGISAFLQAVRYLKGIQSYLINRSFNFDVDYSICLIGKTIDLNSSYCYLCDLLPYTDFNFMSFLSNYTYSFTYDGIYFNEHFGYKLNEEGF